MLFFGVWRERGVVAMDIQKPSVLNGGLVRGAHFDSLSTVGPHSGLALFDSSIGWSVTPNESAPAI